MLLDLFDPAAVRKVTDHTNGARGTALMWVDGLWLALIDGADGVEAAVTDLTERMRGDATPSGVLILSQSLAATTFGPVPPSWLAQGVSMHRSTYADVQLGAYAFLHDYLLMMQWMDSSLAALDGVAQAAQESVYR